MRSVGYRTTDGGRPPRRPGAPPAPWAAREGHGMPAGDPPMPVGVARALWPPATPIRAARRGAGVAGPSPAPHPWRGGAGRRYSTPIAVAGVNWKTPPRSAPLAG